MALATLAAYAGILGNGFVLYDDPSYVLDNHRTQAGLTWSNLIWAATTLNNSNWHPLTWLSHMADVEIFGLNPAGHHAVSVILHLANSLLLMYLLIALTKRPWRSAAVAALFALHPMHVESVAWVSERKDVLSTLFMLCSLLAWVAYTRHGRLRSYLGALALFALGLAAKPMLVTLPCLMLLLDWWPLNRLATDGRRPPARRAASLAIEKIPFFALSAASCMVTYMAQSEGHSVASLQAIPFVDRLANAAMSCWAYLAKTVWPTKLAIFYPHPALNDTLTLRDGLPAALALVAVSMLLWSRRRTIPAAWMGWIWFLGTLVPVIGIIQVGSQGMADRYVYIPHIGLFIALIWSLAQGLEHLKSRIRLPAFTAFAALAVVLATLFTLTVHQVGRWRDTKTLFNHALEVTEGNYMAQMSMASQALREGDTKEFLSHYGAAVRISPSFTAMYLNIHANRMVVNAKFDMAMFHYMLALSLFPDYASALVNRGVLEAALGRVDAGIAYQRRALEQEPDDPTALRNLNEMLKTKDRLARGIPTTTVRLRSPDR